MTDYVSDAGLTGGRRMARNTLWNVAGQVFPLIVGVFCIPVLVRHLGIDRFGLLTLAWLVAGYLSLFDLGLGRAVTKMIADGRHRRPPEFLATTAWTAQAMLLALGLVGGAAGALATPFLVHRLLRVPISLQPETLVSCLLLAMTIPLVTTSSGLRGVLEGYQRFDLVNYVRVPIGILTFLGPVLIIPLGAGLVPAVASLVGVRTINVVLYLLMALRMMPALRKPRLSAGEIRPLLGFGGWITVSSIVGPLMVSTDRFLLGALVSIASVAYYATPYEVATKMWIIPGALASVLFPAFAMSSRATPERVAVLFARGAKYVLLILAIPTLAMVLLAPEGLRLWLGPDFAAHSALVLQLLAIAVLVNSLAFIPTALIQGSGRPDLTAKLHMVELPFYLAVLWLLVTHFGVVGAAMAWLARVTVDCLVLAVISFRILRAPRGDLVWVAYVIGSGVLVIALGLTPMPFAGRVCYLIIALVVGGPVAWRFLLADGEREFIRGLRHLPSVWASS